MSFRSGQNRNQFVIILYYPFESQTSRPDVDRRQFAVGVCVRRTAAVAAAVTRTRACGYSVRISIVGVFSDHKSTKSRLNATIVFRRIRCIFPLFVKLEILYTLIDDYLLKNQICNVFFNDRRSTDVRVNSKIY